MARLQEALRSLHTLRLLGDIGRSGGSLASVADLVDNFADSQQMTLCLERFPAPDGLRP